MGHETKKDIIKLEQLKRELVHHPKDANNLLEMAMLLCEPFHKIEDSISYFEEAMELDPKNPNIPFWMGYFLCMEMFEYEKAKKLFERALSIDPDSAVFNDMMFFVLSETGQINEVAIEYLLKAIKLQPEWLNPRKKYITYLVDCKEYDKAEKELESLYSTIERRCKNNMLSALNILEEFYFGDTGSFNCEAEKKNVYSRRKELREKKHKEQC